MDYSNYNDSDDSPMNELTETRIMECEVKK